MFKRPIAISLSPNTQKEDVLAALKMLFSPWGFLKGEYVGLLEEWFRRSYKVSSAVSFASGRGALFAILKSLGVDNGDEVILQAFTCVAVPNSITATGARPVYVDVDKSLTIDLKDMESKITKKTRTIIVQHTFGIPAEISQILKIAKSHKISVIEDCAHAIGVSYNGKKLGSFADAAFFSFGRDKAFSSVFGGMAITANKILGERIRAFQKRQNNPSIFWIMQQLFHPIAFYLILSLYNFFSLGKIILFFFQTIHFLSFPVLSEEKSGKLPGQFVKKLPNALSYLALFQLKKINKYNKKREEISNLYIKDLSQNFIVPYSKPLAFLRFPVLIENRDKILELFKKRGIYIGKWYSEVIDPKGVDFEKIYYQKGSCPNAEYFSKRILNLPTYPIMKVEDAEKVVKLLNKYAKDSEN